MNTFRNDPNGELNQLSSRDNERCKDWLARTIAPTIFIVAGAGNMAFSVHYALAHDIGHSLLALAGGICGCWAGITAICADIQQPKP